MKKIDPPKFLFQFISYNILLFIGFLPTGTQASLAQAPGATQLSSPAIPEPPPPPIGPSSDRGMQPLAVPPKNLMVQRLHPASYPVEAEIRCGATEPCLLGLSRGFVVGADVSHFLTTSFLGQFFYKPGTWFFYDGFAGFQFLQQVDNKIYANGAVGYRGFSYQSSDGRKISTQGFTFKISYGQEITPTYVQGLVFSLFPTRITVTGDASDVYAADPQNRGGELRDVAKAFYEYSQKHPRVSLYFPADLEVINWKASYVDLPNHIRGYFKICPYYLQNDFILADTYSFVEKNFGLRLAMTTTYESAKEKTGRFALLGSLGMDISATDLKPKDLRATSSGGIKLNDIVLPKRPLFDFYANIEGSYQF